MSNKRVRGLAIHRPILYGSTSTPLTPAEKLAAPPDHTHKWTVAVRSAASHPLPSLSAISGLNSEQGSELAAVSAAAATASTETSTSASAAGGSAATIATRGRDLEHDYHKMVGGKDDISHFIKRVQFKLHDTYAQPTRNIDRPPFQVTESGWGEFEIQIKIFFVPEANEKPITLFHHLKLHPWLQTAAAVETANSAPSVPAPVPAADMAAPAEPSDAASETEPVAEASTSASEPKQEPGTESMDVDPAPTAIADASSGAPAEAPAATNDATTTATAPPKPTLPPVVHSWQYDEIVFPEPMEPFYDILSTHPPTPLPPTSALAFADPSAYRSYQFALADAAKGKPTKTPLVPPHPLHTPTGYLFDALSHEAQQAEGERLDMARIAAIRALEKDRDQLIRAEKALKEARTRIAALNNAALANGTATSAAVPPAS